jgi:hypothetical protein
MRLLTVNFLIRLAIRANSTLNAFHKPIKESLLIFSCFFAYRALEALFGHLPVFFGDGGGNHNFSNFKVIGIGCFRKYKSFRKNGENNGGTIIVYHILNSSAS